nr:helix-turn-helix domain-containing protein [Lachnospiraceae bacterium]
MKSPGPTGFSRNLKRLRKEMGLSQEALAELIGTSNTTICRYETGSQAPTRQHRAKLAYVFGAPGYCLFDEEHISGTYTPEATMRRQEKTRLAMLSDDFEYVEETAHGIQVDISTDPGMINLLQIKNYLICWSFFRQGAPPEAMLTQMLECLQLT